jgi:pyridoxamine 5'-phosphate oxidase
VNGSPRAATGDPREEAALEARDMAGDWITQFQLWLREATAAGIFEPTAMVLATAGAGADPSARMVLMKEVDGRGFVFFSNRDSRKGADLAANRRASLVFPWHAMHRQVVVAGAVAELDDERSDSYFGSRPYGSQIAARASDQSRVIASRAELEAACARAEASFPPGSAVPRPPWWGGWRVEPETVEFWQGRRDRRHDRLRYRREGERWALERLSP